jgi:hypothetical protein
MKKKKEKTIVITDKITYAKAKKRRNLALTIIYLVVIIAKEKKKVDFLSFSTLYRRRLFYLKAVRSNNDE